MRVVKWSKAEKLNEKLFCKRKFLSWIHAEKWLLYSEAILRTHMFLREYGANLQNKFFSTDFFWLEYRI